MAETADLMKVISFKEAVSQMHAQFSVPKGASSYVVCLKIQGCENDEVSPSLATKGLCVIGAGSV